MERAAEYAAQGATVVPYSPEKDESDLELAIAYAADAKADELVLLGILGGPRFDHELANTLLIAAETYRGRLRAVHGDVTVRALHGGERLELEGTAGDVVTLLAVRGDAEAYERIDSATRSPARPCDSARRADSRTSCVLGAWVACDHGVCSSSKRALEVSRECSRSWRTVDIVVTAAIAVAFGVVFWAWNALWAAATPAFAAVPPLQNVLYGTWLAAGVVAGLVVQKPGAALFAELVAASVSLILGSQWGLDAALSGLFQGAGAELAFALFRYRRWDLFAAVLAAILSAVGAWVHDTPLYYAHFRDGSVSSAVHGVSAVVIAGSVRGGSRHWCRPGARTVPIGPEQQRI